MQHQAVGTGAKWLGIEEEDSTNTTEGSSLDSQLQWSYYRGKEQLELSYSQPNGPGEGTKDNGMLLQFRTRTQ
jgi:hypothetical protein